MKNTDRARRIEALNTSRIEAINEHDLYRVGYLESALTPAWEVTRYTDAARTYEVMVDEYDWSCTCPACKRDSHCKHVEIVRLHVEAMNALEARADAFDQDAAHCLGTGKF
ncbi:hypothetical protein [Armatimonas sp.]|uniref:hypothetical protein n=1 Tax=Armatimonas sp. TaxID=1872638 RepID=UPI00286D2971|nr:hypothetical protein [Armatimonas sp.]